MASGTFFRKTVTLLKERHTPASIALVSTVLLILGKCFKPMLITEGSASIGIVMLPIIVFILPSAVLIRTKDKHYLKRLLLKPGKPETILLSLISSLVLISGGLLLSILTAGIRRLPGAFTLYDTFEASLTGSPENTLFLLIAYALLPAIGEELLFRGILRHAYERYGGGIAILLPALLFTMVHFQPTGIPVYLFSGLLLGFLAYVCRSVTAAVIAHFLYNVFGLFGQPYISSFYYVSGSKVLFIFVLVFVLLLSLALFFGETARLCRLYADRNLPLLLKTPPLPEKGVLKQLLLAPDMIASAVVWVIASVLFAIFA